MNYLELADAYDKQADVLFLASGDAAATHEVASLALELREKAQDMRSAHRREEDHYSHREFEYKMRREYLELERRNAAAREKTAEAYGNMVEFMKSILPKPPA